MNFVKCAFEMKNLSGGEFHAKQKSSLLAAFVMNMVFRFLFLATSIHFQYQQTNLAAVFAVQLGAFWQ